MTASIFGAHLLDPLDQGAVQSAERAQVPAYKTMASDLAPIETFLARKPDGLVILRHFFELSEQEQYRRDGDYGAETVARRIASNFAAIIAYCKARNVPVYAEGLNEPNPNPWDDLPNLATWYIHFAAHCESLGLRPLAYSWGTGNPPTYGWGAQNPRLATYEESNLAMWQTLYPGLKACHDAGGGGAWHAYDWPGWLTDPFWQGLRFLNDLDALEQIDPAMTADLFVAITEASIDVGIKPEYVQQFGERKGWRTALHGDGAEYARQAGAYEQAIRASRWARNIKVVIPFTGGKGGGWADYSTDDTPEYEALIREQAQGGTTVPKQTTIEALNTPSGQPGESVEFRFRASGIDGQANGYVAFEYPLVPGTSQTYYGPPSTVQTHNFTDGDWSVQVAIPPNTTPLPGDMTGSLFLEILELGGSPVKPVEDGGKFGPFNIAIMLGSPDSPGTPPQPANDAKDALDQLWALAQALRVNHDTKNAEYIESRVIRLKAALGL
jgi:hypothetical protein